MENETMTAQAVKSLNDFAQGFLMGILVGVLFTIGLWRAIAEPIIR